MMVRFVNIAFLRGLVLTGALAMMGMIHPNHVTLTELYWNPQTGNFEVAICVWPDELEKAITGQTETPIRLEDEAFEKSVNQYVKERFKISKSSEDAKTPMPMRWVGMEITQKKRIWLYFEIKASQKPQDWILENSLFFELNDDQINHLKVKQEKSVAWYFWSATQPVVRFHVQPNADHEQSKPAKPGKEQNGKDD